MTPLYSQHHMVEQQQLLYNIEDYSRGALFIAEALSDYINENQYSEILDYGAGLGLTKDLLELNHQAQYFPYDPAIPEFSTKPSPKYLTLAINVFEYCELEFLPKIINDLRHLTKQSTFIAINTRPLGNITPTIMQPNSWWIKQLCNAFEFSYYRQVGNGMVIIADPIATPITQPTAGLINSMG